MIHLKFLRCEKVCDPEEYFSLILRQIITKDSRIVVNNWASMTIQFVHHIIVRSNFWSVVVDERILLRIELRLSTSIHGDNKRHRRHSDEPYETHFINDPTSTTRRSCI